MQAQFYGGCYATMTPKGELIKIMEGVGEKVLEPETNPFRMDDTHRERESHIFNTRNNEPVTLMTQLYKYQALLCW